jgi:hypothetical protein
LLILTESTSEENEEVNRTEEEKVEENKEDELTGKYI